MPKYKTNILVEDFVAGLTVALTAVPQGIAYAVVAGLPPQYGLYSAFMGCFVYFVFGSCKDITIGPTAITALLIQAAVMKLNIDFAILATFLSGIVILFCGILNLGTYMLFRSSFQKQRIYFYLFIGFVVQFISAPVVAAFTTGKNISIFFIVTLKNKITVIFHSCCNNYSLRTNQTFTRNNVWQVQ